MAEILHHLLMYENPVKNGILAISSGARTKSFKRPGAFQELDDWLCWGGEETTGDIGQPKKKLGHFVIFMLCLRIQTYGFLLSLFLRTGVEPSDIFFIVASSRWCFRLPPLGVVGPCSCKNAYCSCWTLLVRWSWSLSLMSHRVIHEVLTVMMVDGCWWWWWLMVGDNDENGPLLMMMMMMMMMMRWTTTCIFQLGN